MRVSQGTQNEPAAGISDVLLCSGAVQSDMPYDNRCAVLLIAADNTSTPVPSRKLGQSQRRLAELEKLHNPDVNPGRSPDRRMLYH